MDQHIPNEEKSKQIEEAFSIFCSQFEPNDVYLQIFLEVLIEEIHNGTLCQKKLWEILRRNDDH